MKKIRILAVVAVLTAALTIAASASKGTVEKTLSYNDIRITLDGREITPRDANGDYVEPFIIDGTTYLPVRAVAGALGLEVGWDQETKTVQLKTAPSLSDYTPPTLIETHEIDDVSVALTQVRRNMGTRYFYPSQGNEYLVFEFRIQNNSNKSVTISSALSFKAYIDGEAVNVNISSYQADGGEPLDVDIPAGESVVGVVGYEVPQNWKEAEIRYRPSILASQDIVFRVTPGDVQ